LENGELPNHGNDDDLDGEGAHFDSVMAELLKDNDACAGKLWQGCGF
jgi:hypothetical protein